MTSNKPDLIPDDAGETQEPETTFPVVGIGASAGGLEAASELLSGLSATTGMAFLLVQHLDPRHHSRLAEIVATKTPLAVVEVKNRVTIEPNHLYVISPNTNLTLSNGCLRVSPREARSADHRPIDTLFESLARERGRQAVGVILSGSGSDGARGLQAIKDADGMTFVEDPAKAEFPDMPHGAIEARCADYIMSPRAIAEALVRIGHDPDLKAGAVVAMGDLRPPDTHLRRIFRLLYTGCGIDFSHYKPSSFRRRLERRMTMLSIAELGAYADVLERSESELEALCQDALIQVTGFFREPQTFKALSELVFPALLAGHSCKNPIRIWVPGCASGEEVYSLAIGLVEFLDAQAMDVPIQIFGTDASTMAIEKARAGHYPKTLVKALSAERLQRFFVKLNDHYQVARSIRDLCIFARQDVARDPPFSKLDLVSCQNLLIYLDQALQKQVLAQFHRALNPGGFLALGRSENVGASSTDLFQAVDRQHKIYRKPTAPQDVLRVSADTQLPGLPVQAIKAVTTPVDANRAQREAERLLIARYAPACVLVNQDMQVLYFQGETSRYLEHAPGPASLSLHKLARPALLVELAQAMQAVRKEDAPVRREVRIMDADHVRALSIEVIARKLSGAEGHYYLILFEPAPSRATVWNAHAWLARRWPTWLMRSGMPALRRDAAPPTMSRDDQTLQLKRELAATRDYLQARIEEHDAEKETMRSLHEELLSVNEEFQSTNEELETAKEELQASNEELMTTNDELRIRNRDLDELGAALERSRDYANAIIETVGECLLVLDDRCRVLQANHAFYTWFNTTPEETERRLVYDLEDGAWNIPGLRALLEQILPKDATFHDFEISHQFPSLGQRTMRFNGRRLAGDPEGRELILLSIDDITARVQREQVALVAEKERYRATLASISEGVIATDAGGRVEYMNKVAEQYTGWSQVEARGLPLAKVFTVVDGITRKPLGNAAQIAVNNRRPAVMGTHLHLLCRYGEEFPIEATTAPLHGADAGAITGVVVSFRDVSAERRMAQQLSYQANHDALTGLVNRREFERRLRRVIDMSDSEHMHAMMYLDLDQFKLVNDTCGHSAGDKLLRQITAILQSQMRVRDTLARLGGDEFGVLLEHCPLEEALRVANDLRHSIENFRFVWEGQYFTLGMSIGVVSVTESDGSLEAVLSAADKACYAAKEAGRNRVHVYQLEDEAMARRHGDMQWVPRIQAALDEGRFRLYCQPIVALAEPNGSEREWGEILVRLVDEEGRLILPAEFLPAAERYDLMYNIDRWVIKQALAIMRTQTSEASPMRCTINVSGQSLGNEDLMEFVTEQLEGIEAARVCFEITESAAIGNLSGARKLISTLSSHGCRFALDDFGAGLSSFTYLKNLPVEYLKIDGSFVRNMSQSPVDCAVVEATRHIGQALGVKIIAESVEDTSTLEALKAMGVDYAQGLAIAAPRALESPK